MKTSIFTFFVFTSFFLGTYLVASAAVAPLNLSLTMDANAPLVAVNNVTVVSTSSADRYFKFIPAQSGVYSFVSKTNYDPYIYIYDSNGSQLGYNDDNDYDYSLNFSLSVNLTAGYIYYVGIGNNENNAILYVPIAITGVLIGSPEVITNNASLVTASTATLNAEAIANNGSTDVIFEYGTTTSYGATAKATLSPLTGVLSTAVSANISGLAPNTTYHFRVKALNVAGVVYGSDLTFSTGAISTAVENDIAVSVSIYTRQQTVFLYLPKAALVQIYDLTGHLIKEGLYNHANNSFELPQKGIYLVRVCIDNQTVTRKIVFQ